MTTPKIQANESRAVSRISFFFKHTLPTIIEHVTNTPRRSAGETLYYTDKKAKLGVEYTYRVIPINSELLGNGVLLEGNQAVQGARAQSPGAGR